MLGTVSTLDLRIIFISHHSVDPTVIALSQCLQYFFVILICVNTVILFRMVILMSYDSYLYSVRVISVLYQPFYVIIFHKVIIF